MTEAEALEVIGIYTANAHTSFTLYISITFAYFAAAHLVGRHLSRYQAFAATGLYILGAGAATLALVANIQVWGEVAATTTSVMDNLPLFRAELWIFSLSTIMTIGVFISLYYMWEVRHQKAA